MRNSLSDKDWQELVLCTALLMGYEDAGFPTYGYWERERWLRARKWLWVTHGMHVRQDGTIYQRPDNDSSSTWTNDGITWANGVKI